MCSDQINPMVKFSEVSVPKDVFPALTHSLQMHVATALQSSLETLKSPT